MERGRPVRAPSQEIGRELEALGVLPLCIARTRNEVRVHCEQYEDWADGKD
jgi:hypothetical protein